MHTQQFCEKLAHYAARKPKKFLQFDCFYMPNGGDDNIHPDEDGDSVSIRMIEPLPEIDIQTYIITIENNHNFYAHGILVHNK